jgi:hypothetical protein
MNNEQYLIVSYFVIGLACVGLAFATFALLRCSFTALTNAVPGGRLGRVFRRLFLVGIVLPSMAGFFSVTFRSCGKERYQAITADLSYLVAKNQEQLSTSLSYITIALLVWGGILSIGFLATNRREKKTG